MSNEMMLYLFTRLDGIIHFCAFATGISFCVCVGFLTYLLFNESDYNTDRFIYEDCNSEEYKRKFERAKNKYENNKKFCKKVSLIFFICGLFFCFSALLIPTSKETAFIYLGGKTIDYVQGNEELKEIPDNAIKILNSKLKEYLNENEDKK